VVRKREIVWEGGYEGRCIEDEGRERSGGKRGREEDVVRKRKMRGRKRGRK
jgi:hypothetical protein